MESTNRFDKQQFLISLITLLAGFYLTWFGYRESLPLWRQANQLFSISPDTYYTSLLIIGIACLVAGFTGIIRGNSI
jgi:TRAP-type C4-dicarboxylate transport system permease small subunit